MKKKNVTSPLCLSNIQMKEVTGIYEEEKGEKKRTSLDSNVNYIIKMQHHFTDFIIIRDHPKLSMLWVCLYLCLLINLLWHCNFIILHW